MTVAKVHGRSQDTPPQKSHQPHAKNSSNRNTARNPRPCVFFARKNGNDCRFSHGSAGKCGPGGNENMYSANRSHTRNRTQKPCVFFAKGRCRYGDSCRFSHASVQTPPPQETQVVAPLKRSSNGWKPSKGNDNLLDATEKQVKGILNKMTKEKFDKLSAQMCEIPISNEDTLAMVIHQVHQKAINEPAFGDMYADLCVKLAASQGSPFHTWLLTKCEQELYGLKSKLQGAQETESDDEEHDLRCINLKKQMLGNIKFIGQLYRKGLLQERIIQFCIVSLLKLEDSSDNDIDLEDHEAICNMLTTVGSTMDKPETAGFLGVCFAKTEQLSLDTENLPARSRFMYKDLLELRANNWVPRRDEGKAKTLQEIKRDFEQEEKQKRQQSQAGWRTEPVQHKHGNRRRRTRNKLNK